MSYFEQHLKDKKVSNYPKNLINYLTNRFNIKGVLVDIGCGLGGYTREFVKHPNLTVVALDIEQANIEGATFIATDLMKNIPPVLVVNKADVIFSKSVIEHLTNCSGFFSQCKFIAKKNALLIVIVPDWESGYKSFYNDYTHVRPYTLTSLYEVVPKKEWKNINVEKLWQVPFAWRYPRLFYMFRWVRFFITNKDLKNRMTVASLLLTAERADAIF